MRIQIFRILVFSSILVNCQSWANILLDGDFVVIQQVAIDKKNELSDLLPMIKNYLDKSGQKSTISFQNPAILKRGYQKIPNLIWFLPSQKEFLLEPNQDNKIKDIYLHIPAKVMYYNQHYQSELRVTTQKAISVEIAIPVWIETESKVFTSCRGLEKTFGFMPIAVNFTENKKEEKIYIYNNTGKKQEYTVFLVLPPQKSGCNVMVQSPDYEWLNDDSCIDIDISKGKKIARNRYEVKLKSGKILPIAVKLIEKKFSKKMEALLVAVPKNSSDWKFARIRIN
ncbi:MAG: hypothetical protein HY919_01830 [Elusimicrobia bacterium]|nr:hypothetical protein [Elusimicrobiota bacterium]